MSNLVRAVAAMCAFAIVNSCMVLGFMYTYPEGPPPVEIIKQADIEAFEKGDDVEIDSKPKSGSKEDDSEEKERKALLKQQKRQAQDEVLSQIPKPEMKAWWAGGGYSYHLDKACEMLKKRKEISVGTIEKAIRNNMLDACDLCAGG